MGPALPRVNLVDVDNLECFHSTARTCPVLNSIGESLTLSLSSLLQMTAFYPSAADSFSKAVRQVPGDCFPLIVNYIIAVKQITNSTRVGPAPSRPRWLWDLNQVECLKRVSRPIGMHVIQC